MAWKSREPLLSYSNVELRTLNGRNRLVKHRRVKAVSQQGHGRIAKRIKFLPGGYKEFYVRALHSCWIREEFSGGKTKSWGKFNFCSIEDGPRQRPGIRKGTTGTRLIRTIKSDWRCYNCVSPNSNLDLHWKFSRGTRRNTVKRPTTHFMPQRSYWKFVFLDY